MLFRNSIVQQRKAQDPAFLEAGEIRAGRFAMGCTFRRLGIGDLGAGDGGCLAAGLSGGSWRAWALPDLRFSTIKALALALLCGVLASGCTSIGIYTVRTTQGPAVDLADAAYGLSLGEASHSRLVEKGWVLVEQDPRSALWVRAVPEPDIRDLEAETRKVDESTLSVELIRMHFQRTRWTTYERLLKSLIQSHGRPQSSIHTDHYEHYSSGQDFHGVRPTRFVVHSWEAPGSRLVLVAGIEAMENMLNSMEYQLLLIRAP